MEPVRSHRSKLVVDAARLHRSRARKERSQTLIEGPHLLRDALDAGVIVKTAFALASDEETADLSTSAAFDLRRVDDRALGLLSDTETPRGPVCVIEIPQTRSNPDANILVSCGISDPGNVGALIRLAAAFGWSYGYLPGSADPWAPKTLRGGAGGHFRTPICRLGGVDDLAGWTTIATVVRGGEDLSSLDLDHVAVLVGEEGSGLGAEVIEGADVRVSIPMSDGIDSLNAAVAAGIVVYALSKGKG